MNTPSCDYFLCLGIRIRTCRWTRFSKEKDEGNGQDC